MSHDDTIPSRIQEEIQIFNLSLPMRLPPINGKFDDFDPVLAELLRAVECPVCRCVPIPPLYNCENGHFSCNSCRPRLPSQKCAFCMACFTEMRNYPLENLVTAKVFPCDFRTVGCKVRDLNMAEYEDHMRTCWYRPMDAPKRKPATQDDTQGKMEQLCCPRCNVMNSKRKIKCQNCEINLRVPTPMCSRPLRFQGGRENVDWSSIDGDSL